MGTLAVAALLAVPALAFTLWPLWRPRAGRSLLPLPLDPRQQLLEEKQGIYAALRELDFEHDAGHLGDDDYATLRGRYEANAARILQALDDLGPAPERPPTTAVRRPDASPTTRPVPWTRRPLTIGAGGALLVIFGIALGLGAARYSELDRSGMAPLPGSRPLAPLTGMPAGNAPAQGTTSPSPLSPDVLQGMLRAARASLVEGRYAEAIAAYQAVLKRDPRNVDALTHLGLIVAVGGHADAALETFDRALAIDPAYPSALLYRGQVLYEMKHDYAAAATAWDKFLAAVPRGEDHDRVMALAAEARRRAASAPPLTPSND
jgi:tetratricopeptide (TPR) repeat protein